MPLPVFFTLVLACLFLQRASAQIDATLFGDGHGPPIADLPDVGDDWLVVEESPPPPPRPHELSITDTSLPEEPQVDPPRPDSGERDFGKRNPEAKAPEAVRERPVIRRGSQFSWKNRQRAQRPPKQERNEYGPRLGKARFGVVGGNVDLSPLPSGLGRWKRDPRKAMAQARAQRKLLLLLVTDSLRSPSAETQEIEVFRHTQFLRMAKDHMVLTRLDLADAEIASHKYTRHLKEKLKIMGFPVLVLFAPDSKEVWRHNGYRSGRSTEIISDLRYQVKTFALKERDRREKLLAEGYRTWVNDKKQSVFAKATGVSREEKTVLLVNEYGENCRYSVVRLSEKDRRWLAEKFLR